MPHSTVQIEVNPSELSQEERDFIADHLVDGHEFTWSAIVPPTYEGFTEAVKQGMEHEKNKLKTHDSGPPPTTSDLASILIARSLSHPLSFSLTPSLFH